MIARHEAHMDKTDIWASLAAALPAGVVSWRQDGKPTQRDGKYFARFVAYIEANTVRERLDSVVPGEWDLTLELLPPLPSEDGETSCSFKARLQILGVIREDVGTGRDYKSAATDAFKRAAVRFGIGHELYAYEQNWVQVDSDSKYAKPVEDPQTAYTRRYGTSVTPKQERQERAAAARVAKSAKAPKTAAASANESATEQEADAAPELVAVATPVALEPEVAPSCPKCGGKMWDNRATKRNPKAPDFKCRDRTCDGVIWPPRPVAANGRTPAPAVAQGPASEPDVAFDSGPLGDADEIPF
jgi:hypothetical protein